MCSHTFGAYKQKMLFSRKNMHKSIADFENSSTFAPEL